MTKNESIELIIESLQADLCGCTHFDKLTTLLYNFFDSTVLEDFAKFVKEEECS
jgi:hypothetical protein